MIIIIMSDTKYLIVISPLHAYLSRTVIRLCNRMIVQSHGLLTCTVALSLFVLVMMYCETM